MASRTSRVLWTMFALQVLVLLVLVGKRASTEVPPPALTLTIGDTVPALVGLDSAGRPDTVALAGNRSSTAILAFSSTCVFCDEVAPQWRAWLQARLPNVDPLLLAREAESTADAYRHRQQWTARLLVVPQATRATIEGFLTSRTPWLFVFDASGRLVHMGHGSEVDRVDSLAAAGVLR